MKPLPLKVQLTLFDQLIGLHSAGLGQKDILLQLQKFGGKSEQTVAKYALNEMGKGLSLAHSLKPFLSELAFQSLLAGESTGHPQQGLEDAKRVLSTQNFGASTLIKAMALPLAISVMLLGVAALCSAFVFPALAEQMHAPMGKCCNVCVSTRPAGEADASYFDTFAYYAWHWYCSSTATLVWAATAHH
ncbi:hypothetical protein JCM19239_1445 [Vibrio variabilis]|uniref:Type II secretion system protein GspF domain-containing protein n=1 Tax=Vibrio variabilis TaxID=990271 RepID=A0ABQ0JG40_9VIBR|nr:hypothetical protein JCM19239_1445 [Vibrio variabilis]